MFLYAKISTLNLIRRAVSFLHSHRFTHTHWLAKPHIWFSLCAQNCDFVHGSNIKCAFHTHKMLCNSYTLRFLFMHSHQIIRSFMSLIEKRIFSMLRKNHFVNCNILIKRLLHHNWHISKLFVSNIFVII